ncbi:MAG: helix-turn-helix transcriptional regulator [Holosporales bacterium]|nr:helix-turn-helix transcriptional regulator [Holosporales bacterium]
MSALSLRIKKKLVEHNLSASALERKAGIRPSTLQNILQGRSKNPSIEVLQSVAQALNCSVSELLGENHALPETLVKAEKWVPEVYVNATQAVWAVCKKRQLDISKKLFFQAVEQVYAYCSQYDRVNVDKDFADWVVMQVRDKENER